MQYQMMNPAMMPQFMGATAYNPYVQASPFNVQFNLQHGGNVQPQMVEQNVQNNQVAAPANDEEQVNDILGVVSLFFPSYHLTNVFRSTNLFELFSS